MQPRSFYLPRDAQRTSVDIDMLFFGTEEEIKETLRKIEEYLGTEDELFYFHKHSPKNPKTNLPLHTYYTKVPSVLSNAERNMDRESIPYQELKNRIYSPARKNGNMKEEREKTYLQ